ncbi:MAG: AAA family ATPase [Halioglobus sp.]
MYERYFNLTVDPFRLSPDHRFCFEHPQYSKAKSYLAYGYERADGFVMVTGPPGTGKTTLIADFLAHLEKNKVWAANIMTTQLGADDFLRMVSYAFGVSAQRKKKATVLHLLTERLRSHNADGGRALLIVDEAQDLTFAALEELRLLSNLQQNGQPLLQVFLLGQPELREHVRDKALTPLYQRIIATSQLHALNEGQTRQYVEHRLKVAGWENDPIISSAVYSIIFQFSEGIPRRINLICNRLFLHCHVGLRHKITVADAYIVVRELHGEQLTTRNILSSSIFDAQDVFDTFPGLSNSGGANYTGTERRHKSRRTLFDRRIEIRLDTGSTNRRRTAGRRQTDLAPQL